MRLVRFDQAAKSAKPVMMALVAATVLLEAGCAPRHTASPDAAQSTVALAPSTLSQPVSQPVVPADASAAAALAAIMADPPDVATLSSDAVAIPEAIQSPEPALPAPAAEPEVPAAPVAPAPVVPAVPAAPATPLLEGVQRPFAPRIERWRPLVRQALAEAAAEGRLRGGATRLNDDLLLAMIQQESAGDPTAESWAGALGLMQVMPGTFSGFMYGDWNVVTPRETIMEPELNVRVGVRYMAESLQILGGDLYWALASYNAGVGAVQAWRSVGLTAVPPIGGYTETAAYAPVILNNYATRRPGVQVHIPAPITDEEIPGIVALLTQAGLW